MHTTKRNLFSHAAAGCAVVASCAAANADTTIDLSISPTATAVLAGARYEVVNESNASPMRTFVQLRRDGVQHGFNTGGSTSKFHLGADSGRNRSIRLADLVTTADGAYFEFFLDVNQDGGQSIQLQQLEIFTDSRQDLTTATLAFETHRYSLDKTIDRTVIIGSETATGGSGRPDLRVLVPTASFFGARQTDFIYLYSQFAGANGGFEEWGMRDAQLLTSIPLPTTAGLGLVGLAAVAMIRRRR